MGDFRVEISQLDTVNGVFTLQTGHMTKVQSYVQTNCNAGNGFTGLAVAPLQGHYDRAYSIADVGTGQGRTISENCTTTLNGTKRNYLAQDRAAYDRMAAQMRAVGDTPPPYRPPGAGPAPQSGSSLAGATPDSGSWGDVKKAIGAPADAFQYVDKGRSLGPLGSGMEAPKPPEYPDNLNPAKWREYAMASRIYNGMTGRWDDQTALEHNQRNTGGNTSWTREDAQNLREQAYQSDRQTARDGFWNQVDWAEADRRNGADTTGNSSYTADDMRTEREATYSNPAPTDGRGTTWDANQTFGAAQRTLGLPGALISTGEGLINTVDNRIEAETLSRDVQASADGPSNDGSINWANESGGNW